MLSENKDDEAFQLYNNDFKHIYIFPSHTFLWSP